MGEKTEPEKVDVIYNGLRADIRRLRDALEFYASSQNWRSPSAGVALQYDPMPSAVRSDGGAVARTALSSTPEQEKKIP